MDFADPGGQFSLCLSKRVRSFASGRDLCLAVLPDDA